MKSISFEHNIFNARKSRPKYIHLLTLQVQQNTTHTNPTASRDTRQNGKSSDWSKTTPSEGVRGGSSRRGCQFHFPGRRLSEAESLAPFPITLRARRPSVKKQVTLISTSTRYTATGGCIRCLHQVAVVLKRSVCVT